MELSEKQVESQLRTGDRSGEFDFDGTDPQSDRSINFALSHEMLKMFIVIYLLTVFVSRPCSHVWATR